MRKVRVMGCDAARRGGGRFGGEGFAWVILDIGYMYVGTGC